MVSMAVTASCVQLEILASGNNIGRIQDIGQERIRKRRVSFSDYRQSLQG